MIRILLLLIAITLSADANAVSGVNVPSTKNPQRYNQIASVIIVTGTFAFESTTYGTPSSTDMFMVSGTFLTAGITITAPAGFQISTNRSISYTSSITVGGAGTLSPTSIYIRLAALTGVSLTGYSGTITLASPGAATVYSSTISGQVNPFLLNLTLIGQNKNYGVVLASGLATGYVLTGANGEVITGATISVDVTGASSSASSGSTYTEGISAATGIGTFNLNNYTITYIGYNGTIQPEPVTVSANDEIRVYGTVNPSGAGSTDFTSQGLQNGETIGSVTLAYTAGNNLTDGVKTYAGLVTVSAATGGTYNPANYLLTYTAANLVVTNAPLTITAIQANKIYGSVLTAGTASFNFTPAGLKNNETVGSVSLSYGTGAAATDPAGTYPNSIIVSSATAGTFNPANYSITYTAGPLVVSPRLVLVTGTTYLKAYGSQLNTGSGFANFTAPALANGETIGSVSMTFGMGAGAIDPVGDYAGSSQPSAATGGSFAASNYTVTYSAGDILVAAAPLTISASPVNKTYGSTLKTEISQTGFTSTPLQNGETIGSVTLAYGAGSHPTDGVGANSGCVNTPPPAALS